MRRSSLPAALALITTMTACAPPASPHAATAAPTPWSFPKTRFLAQYAVPGKTGCVSADPWPPRGTITCTGWRLHLVAKEGVHHGELGGKGCDLERCTSSSFIPDAASYVSMGPGRQRSVRMAISADGRRVAYLSATERRWIGFDLREKVKRHLSPVLTPEEMTDVSVLAHDRFFTVWYGKKGLRTDFTTGATTPSSARKDEVFFLTSPNGERKARVDEDASANGTLEIRESGRVLRRLRLPGLGGATSTSVQEWRGEDEVLLHMSSVEGDDHLGWFTFGVTSGKLRRLPGLPGDFATVVGAPPPR